MGIPDHLTCLLRNLYAGQETTVRTGHGTTDWFQMAGSPSHGDFFLNFIFSFYFISDHQPDGCEFERTPGVGDGQGSLA